MGERLVYPTRVNFTNAEVGRLGTVIYETARELALVTLPPPHHTCPSLSPS